MPGMIGATPYGDEMIWQGGWTEQTHIELSRVEEQVNRRWTVTVVGADGVPDEPAVTGKNIQSKIKYSNILLLTFVRFSALAIANSTIGCCFSL